MALTTLSSTSVLYYCYSTSWYHTNVHYLIMASWYQYYWWSHLFNLYSCSVQFAKYTCPRCNIRYCSLECYKCEVCVMVTCVYWLKWTQMLLYMLCASICVCVCMCWRSSNYTWKLYMVLLGPKFTLSSYFHSHQLAVVRWQLCSCNPVSLCESKCILYWHYVRLGSCQDLRWGAYMYMCRIMKN